MAQANSELTKANEKLNHDLIQTNILNEEFNRSSSKKLSKKRSKHAIKIKEECMKDAAAHKIVLDEEKNEIAEDGERFVQ